MSISAQRVGALVVLFASLALLAAAVAEPPPNQPKLSPQDAAFRRGVQWLAAAQADDGRWSLNNPQHDVAATALGVLPLLRAEQARSTPGGDYAIQADRGLEFIVARQGEDGGFGMGYYHGLASFALCEAYALTGDPTLAGPARKAVRYIVNAQGPNGGWRYVAGQDGDTSVTVWMMQALGAAERGGLTVPRKTWDGAAAYLDTVAGKEGGYGYVTPEATPRMTASGCLGRLLLKTAVTDAHLLC